MDTYYLTGTFNASSNEQAIEFAHKLSGTHIVRGNVINSVELTPRQPGQVPFNVRPDDHWIKA